MSKAAKQAAAELLRRQRARESLVQYALSIEIPAAPLPDEEEDLEGAIARVLRPVETEMSRHHIVTLEAIQRCMEKPGGRGRLMIFEPPGSAKSTYASVVAQAWFLSKNSGTEIIVTSYSDELPKKHSRRIQQIKSQPAENEIWPDKPRMRVGNKGVEQWSLTNGSAARFAGILGGITGNRADGVVIDDPVKNRQEADSPTKRGMIAGEFKDSIKTRLKPRGWIILIMTRWNEDDLAGGILPTNYDGRSGPVKCRDGQTWEVLNIPAKCERADDPVGRKPGEYLWPEWFPREHWEEFENSGDKRTWNALYQQRPSAADGIMFRREDFQYYDPDIPAGELGGPPKNLRIFGASDFATKDDTSADFTEHGVFGIDTIFDTWILDWWYGQKKSDVYIAAWIALCQRWKPQRWWDEGNVIGHAISPARSRAMKEAQPQVRVPCEQITSIASKPLKVAGFQARTGLRKVWVPKPGSRPWADRLVDQLCAFPTGRYDDAVDTCGVFGRGLDRMQGAMPQSEPDSPKIIVPFTAEWLEYEAESDKPSVRYR